VQPSNVELRLAYADIYILEKEYKQAIQLLQQILEASRGNLEMATKLARAYVFDNDYTRATQVYDRYLAQLKPSDPNVPLELGALLLDLERPRDALPFLLAFQEKRPRDMDILAQPSSRSSASH
jgi:predicted Zn-dependent protease